jgi:hypothetical protein
MVAARTRRVPCGRGSLIRGPELSSVLCVSDSTAVENIIGISIQQGLRWASGRATWGLAMITNVDVTDFESVTSGFREGLDPSIIDLKSVMLMSDNLNDLGSEVARGL